MATINVNPYPAPQFSISPIPAPAAGKPFTVTVTNHINGSQYAYDFGGESMVNTTNSSVVATYDHDGSYLVMGTVEANGCSSEFSFPVVVSKIESLCRTVVPLYPGTWTTDKFTGKMVSNQHLIVSNRFP